MVAKNTYIRKKNSRSFQNVLMGGVFLVVFAGIIAGLAMQNVRIYKKRSELAQKEQELKQQIEQLENQKVLLESVIIESDSPDYQEKILREQGLYKKPGEDVVTVLPLEGNQDASLQGAVENTWWDPRTWFK